PPPLSTPFPYTTLFRSPIPVLTGLSLACLVNGAVQTWLLQYGYHDVYWRTDTRAASILLSAAIFLSVQSGFVSFGGLTALVLTRSEEHTSELQSQSNLV